MEDSQPSIPTFKHEHSATPGLEQSANGSAMADTTGTNTILTHGLFDRVALISIISFIDQVY